MTCTAAWANDDRKSIEATIRMYHKGADERKVELLEQAFHEKFRLMVSVDGKLNEIRRDTYLDLIELEKIGGKPRDLRIELVDITGNSAMAKAELSNEKVVFMDYLSLVKDGDHWLIISNTPHIYPRSAE
jgi:hypothetical protein